MKVIVDANIVFSALLNTNGKIGDLLLNSNNLIEFIAPGLTEKGFNLTISTNELYNYRQKVLKSKKY